MTTKTTTESERKLPVFIDYGVTSDDIFQEVLDHRWSYLALQFDEIKEAKWSEEDYSVLEAAMALAAAKNMEYLGDGEAALKYLCFSIEASKKSKNKPGEELRVLLSVLGLTLDSSQDDIQKALDHALKYYAKSRSEATSNKKE